MPSELGRRLRVLRNSRKSSIRATADAMGVTEASVSGWEHGTKLPPVLRLRDYLRLFASPDGPLSVLTDEWTEEQRELLKELTSLRAAIKDRSHGRPAHPWQFPPGDPVTIVCSELPEEYRRPIGYSNPEAPDYVQSYQYADLDSLLELYGDVKARNPTSLVDRVVPSKLTIDQRTAHLIVLGGVDFNQVTRNLLTELNEVPVQQLERINEGDAGGFAVWTPGRPSDDFRPRLVTRGEGRRILREDVAHFLRAPNPYNQKRTITICNGMFARGSFGVVRALTDIEIRDRNTAYLEERFSGQATYSILFRVSVVAEEVVTPDWTLDEVRLHEWPEA